MDKKSLIILLVLLFNCLAQSPDQINLELIQLNSQERQTGGCPTFTTNSAGGSVTDNRVTNTQGLSQFRAENAPNTDWELTQVNNHPGGWICFGYLPANQLASLAANPNSAIYSRAVAVCTDDTYYNYQGGAIQRTGTIQRTAGTVYSVRIVGTNVVVTAANGGQTVTIPKDPNQQYIPWIEINQANAVTIRCPSAPQVPQAPQLQQQSSTCVQFVTNAAGATVDGNRVTNTQGLSQFRGENAPNTDWELTQVNNHPGGWICFGYLPANQLASLTANPKSAIYSRAVAVCTDDTYYNYQGGAILRTGTIQRTAGTVYSIRISSSSVSINAANGAQSVQFPRDLTQQYIPWIEINSPNAVTIRCLDPVVAGSQINGPTNATLTASQTGAAGQIWLYQVPSDTLGNARTYGFSFWLRISYSYPNPVNWGVAFNPYFTGLGGFSESADGSYNGVALGDRSLVLLFANGGYAPQQGFPAFIASSYQLNNLNPQQDIRFPTRDDFEGKWIFVHASYSYQQNSARVWSYFSYSNQVLGLVWNDNIKRSPVPALRFRLGTSVNSEVSALNFQYSNVKVFHGLESQNFLLNSQQAFVSYRDAIPFNTSRNTLNDRINTVIGNSPVTRLLTQTDLQVSEFTGLDAVAEYAVYGWVRWTYTASKGPWHNLYRFSPFAAGDVQDASKVGDRQLACWIGAGFLHISTTTFNYFQGQNANMPQNIDYGQNLESWFFVYQGYSYAQKRVYAFVKWPTSDSFLTWDNIYHQLPDRVTFWLGKDPFYPSINGDLKKFKVHFGSGAYRTSGFDSLYDLEPPVQPFLLQQRLPVGNLLESQQRVNVPSFFAEVPPAELQQINGDYSFAFWYRVNSFYPVRMNQGVERSQFHTLAILSETNSQGVALGDRALALWFTPSNEPVPRYWASTYDTNPPNGDIYRNLPLVDKRDYDSYWNFVYFGYSRDESRAYFYAYHSRSDNVLLQEWTAVQHRFPKPRFTFTLGGFQYPGINGHFFNPQFWYTGRNFMGSRDQIDDYRQNRAGAPNTLLPPLPGQATLVNTEITIQGNTNQAPKNAFNTIDAVGAEEYAIYGWFRWNTFDKGNWPNLFRVSQVGQATASDLGNADKPGDRTFCVWVNADGNIYPATYTSGTNGGDNWNVNVAKQYQDDLESWFWVYMGYSNIVNKVFFFVKWFDREDSWTVEAASHKLPYRFYITVGGEGQWHQSFSGAIKDVHFVWGPGAFRDRNFTILQNIEIDTSSGVEEDYVWTAQPIEIQASNTQRSNDLTETVVPAAQISQIQEYSFSFWFRHSYEDPIQSDLGVKRSQYTPLAGVTERTSYEDISLPGGRALGIWLTPETAGRALHTSTYATNRNNNNDWHNVPYPNDLDYDSVWNFVYFGYSYPLQKAFFYVKFGQSQQIRTWEWTQTVHLTPLQALKFQLGSPTASATQSLCGRFFDVRFRKDNLAFKGSEGNIEWYLGNSVARPTQLNPESSFRLTNGLVTRTQLDAPLVFQYPTLLNGARAYAIWGWAKWTQPTQIQGWNNLFRVTIQAPASASNGGGAGSRTLCVWYNPPGRFLHLRTYRFGTPTGDDFNLGHLDRPAPEVDQWFFIYLGYSVDRRKSVAYIKFATSEYTNVIENLVHKVPKYIGVYLGRDNYYQGWNGQLKGWNFAVGSSSFIETGFSDLYNRPITNDLDMGGNNQFFVSHRNSPTGDNGPVYQENIAEDQLPTTRKAQAWTWFNWQYNSPSNFGNPQVARGKCYHIARLAYSSTNSIQSNLCFNDNGSPSIKFTDNSGTTPQERYVPVPDDLDLSRWNFVYLHHDEDARKSVGVVKFQRTGTKVYIAFTNATWNLPSSIVGLRVSGMYGNNYPFNGFFFDSQVSNSQTLGAQNETDFDRIYNEVTVDPDSFDTNADSRNSTPEVLQASLDANATIRTNPSSPNTPVKNLGSQSRANAYQVFGWIRWTGTSGINQQPQEWTLVYRHAQKSYQDLQDEQNPGDRALSLFVSRTGQLKTSTYDFRDNIFTPRNFSQPINLAPLSSWFFVYHGYSRTAEKAYFALRLADGTVLQRSETNLRHLRSFDNTLYLGRDKFDIYNAWSGEYRSFQAHQKGPIFVDTPEGIQQYAAMAVPPAVPISVEPEQPLLPPQGDCAILYTQCNFTGRSYQFCDRDPDIDIIVQSMYIPSGWTVTLYDSEQWVGRNSQFTSSVQCLESGVNFRLLMQKALKIKQLANKNHRNLNLKKNRRLL